MVFFLKKQDKTHCLYVSKLYRSYVIAISVIYHPITIFHKSFLQIWAVAYKYLLPSDKSIAFIVFSPISTLSYTIFKQSFFKKICIYLLYNEIKGIFLSYMFKF